MNYNLDRILEKYNQKKQENYLNYKKHKNIYEIGIINRFEKDLEENKIKDYDAYFQKLENLLKSFEQKINDEIEENNKKEAISFANAIVAYMLLSDNFNYNVKLDDQLIPNLKKIYNDYSKKENISEVNINEQQIKDFNTEQEIENLFKELHDLLN